MRKLHFEYSELLFVERILPHKIKIDFSNLKVVKHTTNIYHSRNRGQIKRYFYENATNFYIDYCCLLVMLI